jgi:hypothetical protein
MAQPKPALPYWVPTAFAFVVNLVGVIIPATSLRHIGGSFPPIKENRKRTHTGKKASDMQDDNNRLNGCR